MTCSRVHRLRRARGARGEKRGKSALFNSDIRTIKSHGDALGFGEMLAPDFALHLQTSTVFDNPAALNHRRPKVLCLISRERKDQDL